MLHLAQVQRNAVSGEMKLQLLAHQKPDQFWVIDGSEFLPFREQNSLPEGLLVLVEIDDNSTVGEIKPAKDWVLDLVNRYLIKETITPEFVEAEQGRIEQWRQELTSQSQDLTRLRLEVETRREQLQELEASLKQNKKQTQSEE